jgi:hypothetical protein
MHSSLQRTLREPPMKSNCKTTIALPVRQGMKDGSNAHLLVDANGDVIANLFGIEYGLTVDHARKSKLSAKGMLVAQCIVSAINGRDEMVATLMQVRATSRQQRLVRLATEALIAAGELKE